MKLLTIDPSIRALGWAMTFVTGEGKAHYKDSGLISTRQKDDWLVRLDTMVQECDSIAGSYRPSHIICEIPPLRGGFTKKGKKRRTGDILKLMGLVFSLRQQLSRGRDFQLVSPAIWKGHVEKWVTRRRVERRWGLDVEDDNECDAIGIADWYLKKHGCEIVK